MSSIKTRRGGFGRGVVLGAACGLAGLILLGMGGPLGTPGWHVTQSTDGRTAFLWNVDHDGITFVASAIATRESVLGRPADTIAPPATPATPTTPTNAAEAQTMLDQALQLIREGKLDSAEELLSILEQWQGLPESMTSQVQSARTLLNAAKGQGNPLGSLPKLKLPY